MDPVVDRLVGVRAALATAAIFALAGCQCFWPASSAKATGETVTPAAETASAPACPDIIKAEAWVNRMPSIGAAPTKLVVVLGVDSDAPWMLGPLGMSGAGALTLDLKPGGNSVPGTVAYRQPQSAPLPRTIEIMCEARLVARIDEILVVQ